MKGRKPDIARARRLTGHRPLPVPLKPAVEDFGPPPSELQGAGLELWHDAVSFLGANGRSNRVYRHSLRLVCLLLDNADADTGINKLDAIRRYLCELQLTPASSAKGGTNEAQPETGPQRLLQLVRAKQSRGASD
jgi:hypothetical protein